MTSQPDERTITIHILLNISQIKGNQTVKSIRLIKYNKSIFFFKNHAENETRRLVPDFFLLIEKLYIS